MRPTQDSPRLLVMDNDEDLGRLLERTLTNEGFTVSLAKSSEQALQLVNHELFDLALLDVTMPGIDGFEVCRRLKANPAAADVPVLFISGRGRGQEMLAQALSAGGCDYLMKPFSRVDVLTRVRCIVHQRLELLRLRQLNAHDELTGLPGRDHLKGRLEEELAECVRFGNPVSLVLADVDDLATVCEQQGPEASDVWVERFALLLRSECRRYDVVARLEEYRFGLLLPRVSAEGGLKAARRMSEIWRLTTLEVGGLDFYVPALMAVECHNGASPAPSAADVLNRAATSVERLKQNQGLSSDGVVGPTPDPYAVSIWSDYLAPTPSQS